MGDPDPKFKVGAVAMLSYPRQFANPFKGTLGGRKQQKLFPRGTVVVVREIDSAYGDHGHFSHYYLRCKVRGASGLRTGWTAALPEDALVPYYSHGDPQLDELVSRARAVADTNQPLWTRIATTRWLLRLTPPNPDSIRAVLTALNIEFSEFQCQELSNTYARGCSNLDDIAFVLGLIPEDPIAIAPPLVQLARMASEDSGSSQDE